MLNPRAISAHGTFTVWTLQFRLGLGRPQHFSGSGLTSHFDPRDFLGSVSHEIFRPKGYWFLSRYLTTTPPPPPQIIAPGFSGFGRPSSRLGGWSPWDIQGLNLSSHFGLWNLLGSGTSSPRLGLGRGQGTFRFCTPRAISTQENFRFWVPRAIFTHCIFRLGLP